MASSKKKALIACAIVAVIIAVPVVKGLNGSGEGKQVDTIILAPQLIEASILASGTLTHEEEVNLSSEEIGRVKAIFVKEGDRVQKGDLVLQIDDEAHVAAVEQNEAAVRLEEIAINRQQLRLENLESQWKRREQLFSKKLLDTETFERDTNELALARIDLKSSRESLLQRKAQLEQAKNRLTKTRVYAPITGVVTSLDIKVGETAITSTTNIAGSSLMTIANPESIQTEVHVDEADVANIEVGQRAKVVAIAYPDIPVSGTVVSVAITAKQAVGKQGLSFAVKIKLEDTPGVVLRPGMSCRAEIFTHGKKEVPAVPIQAIQVNEDRAKDEVNYFVFINQDGEAKKVEVDTGISDDHYQEIRGGLDLGTEVVIGPDIILRHLNEGDRLRPVVK